MSAKKERKLTSEELKAIRETVRQQRYCWKHNSLVSELIQAAVEKKTECQA